VRSTEEYLGQSGDLGNPPTMSLCPKSLAFRGRRQGRQPLDIHLHAPTFLLRWTGKRKTVKISQVSMVPRSKPLALRSAIEICMSLHPLGQSCNTVMPQGTKAVSTGPKTIQNNNLQYRLTTVTMGQYNVYIYMYIYIYYARHSGIALKSRSQIFCNYFSYLFSCKGTSSQYPFIQSLGRFGEP